MSFRKAILAAAALLLFTSPFYPCPQQQSVAEAARKAREQKQKAPKAGKVITNDDLKPAPGPRGVSVIGSEPAPPAKEKPEEGKPTAGEEKAEKPEEPVKDEAYWRKRFADARAKLRLAEKELDILQRELNLKEMQFYSDPNKALAQQYDRSEINDLRQKIDDKRKEVERLRQALADLELELRQAGGNPGWARE